MDLQKPSNSPLSVGEGSLDLLEEYVLEEEEKVRLSIEAEEKKEQERINALDSESRKKEKAKARNREKRIRKYTGISEPVVGQVSKRTTLDNLPSLFDPTEVISDYVPFAETRMTMDDVREVAGTNGLTSISGFTGCGGSATGFAMSGWNELATAEFVDSARDTYSSNFPSILVSPDLVLKAAKEYYEENKEKYKDYFSIIVNRPTKVKGKIVENSLSWEKMQDSLKENRESKEAFSEFRYEVNQRVFASLKEKHEETGLPFLWGDDIRGLDPTSLMEALNLEPGDLDCFEASPPCKSFSMGGVREGRWGLIADYSEERKQKSDDLFFEYLRVATAMQPKSFIAENVEGLTFGLAEAEVLNPFVTAMQSSGYIVDYRVFNAADFGVPQERPRVFIQGIRKGVLNSKGEQIVPTWPEESSFRYSLEDALDGVDNSEEELVEFWIGSKSDLFRAYPDIDKSLISKLWKTRSDISEDEDRFSIGTVWKRLEQGGAPKDTYFQLIRTHSQRPVPTVTATSAGNIAAAGISHFDEPRKLTLSELKAVFTFPEDFNFIGTREQQGERMGRCVPPFMMKALSAELAKNLKS